MIGRPRIYPINESYFDRLTPGVAYVVGLFQADGANRPNRGVLTIKLKNSDAEHLRAVGSEMGIDRPLHRNKEGGSALCVQSKILSAGLARWGVVSPKTHTASTHADLLNDRDYWRGVIDGDGTLCNAADHRRILSLVGSLNVCTQFLDYCQSFGAGQKVTVRPHKSIYSVHLSGPQATRAADVLYAGAALSLPRKAAVAMSWIADPTGKETA